MDTALRSSFIFIFKVVADFQKTGLQETGVESSGYFPDLQNVRGWRVIPAGDIDQNPQLPGDIDQNSHNCQAILTNFV